MSRRPLLLTAALAGVLALSACGSSGSTVAASSGGSGGPAASAGTSPTTTAQVPGTPLFTVGAVPAVTGADDLTKEPTIAPGTPPAPTAPTGKDLVVGTGTTAGPDATVRVQYVGTLYETGKVFDASWTDNGPISFPLNGVIPGFKDAIVGMRVGGRREIVIPPADGYGAAGSPPAVPGNATLVFVIDLLGVS